MVLPTGTPYVTSGTLSTTLHEFNASFKTLDQSGGSTDLTVGTGLIAKNLRDTIYRALRNFATVPSGSQSGSYPNFSGYDGFNTTKLTVGDVTEVSSDTNQGTYNSIPHNTNHSEIDESNKVNHQQYVFEISSSDDVEFEISAFDSKSGSALGVVYKEVDSISDLPTIARTISKLKYEEVPR